MASMHVGAVGWLDLTVDEADSIRDFYQDVVGWHPKPVNMGEYADYSMQNHDGEDIAGICHKRGPNGDLPSYWLPYFVVENLDDSMQAATAQGGKIVTEVKSIGDSRYVIIKDPAGAVCALYQP
ncbi:VOC family protein [Aestuariibacter salexigens]|uniref:VOC family protein n=1 Tax=Aestuariibacter salexigens TaxID=226010 RepID=UPI000416635D|nr:VOC family protein [Aestuariibacter salexigens]